jgi:hypothetical protein
MRGEQAFAPDPLQRLLVIRCAGLFFGQQLQPHQRRVPFVHLEAGFLIETEPAQYPQTADTQHRLLAQPIALVAAVKVIGQGAIVGSVFRQIGVQHHHRHDGAGDAGDGVQPGAHFDAAPLDFHFDHRLGSMQEVLWRPQYRRFVLAALAVQPLVKMPVAVEQTDRDHQQSEVGRAAQGIAGQHAQASRIGGDSVFQRQLHRKVSYLMWQTGLIHRWIPRLTPGSKAGLGWKSFPLLAIP